MTREQLAAIQTYWMDGKLRVLLSKRKAQLRLYDFVEGLRVKDASAVLPIVLNCHRRLGKTYFGLVRLTERCLSAPGQQCVFAAPTKDQVRSIVTPNLQRLLRTCPMSLRPRTRGHEYLFQRPEWGKDYSSLRLIGCDYRNGDLLRGPWTDEAFLDEAGFTKNLEYLVHDILLYQFRGRSFPMLVISSTAPKSLDHDYARPGDGFIPRAKAIGRYMEIRTIDNPDWTERDDRQLLGELNDAGGKESTSWRREALCELISDEASLITPEYQRARADIFVDSYKRPTHFYPWVGLDTGCNPDYNGVLFGYVDFMAGKLVIEDELWKRNLTTKDLADSIRAKEALLFSGIAHATKLRRVGDITEQQLTDLHRGEGLYVRPAEKWDRDGALAFLRTGIQGRKLVILKACAHLDYQLLHGSWNEGRTDFLRSETIGHWDLGMALTYLYRSVNFRDNPFPEPILSEADHFIYKPRPAGPKVRALLTMVGRAGYSGGRWED